MCVSERVSAMMAGMDGLPDDGRSTGDVEGPEADNHTMNQPDRV